LEYIFTLQQPCHNAIIVQKDYERLDLMIFYPWNFAHVKIQPWKKIKKIKSQFLFKLWSSYQMFKRNLLVHYDVIMKIFIF